MIARLDDPWFEAGFICKAETDGSYRVHHEGGSPIKFEESQGLRLWCPCGYGSKDSGGETLYPLDLSLNCGRPHGVLIVFANPPSGILPPISFGPTNKSGQTHPRWTVVGNCLGNLTLSPSVDVGNPSCWHGFIQNGIIK